MDMGPGHSLTFTHRLCVALAALACLGGCSIPSPRQLWVIAESSPVDPEKYRAPIQSVERLLFRDEPFTAEVRESVSVRILRLQDELAVGENSALAIAFEGELTRLADMTRPRFGPGAEQTYVTTQWQRIRSSLFDDASWFAFNADDVDRENMVVGVETPFDAPAIERLAASLDSLDFLLYLSKPELQRLYKLGGADPTNSPAFTPAFARWNDTFQARLAEVERALPEPPSAPDGGFAAAMDATRQTINTMALFGAEVGTGDITADHRWGELYDEATRRLDVAHTRVQECRAARRTSVTTN